MRSLEKEVKGKNWLRKIGLHEVQNLMPQLQKYIGEKIRTTTGEKTKKFVFELIQLKPEPFEKGHFSSCQIWIEQTAYSLILNIKLCFNGGKYENRTAYTEYFELPIFIGEMDGQILKELNSAEHLIKSYSLDKEIDCDTVKEQIFQYKQLEEQMSKLKSVIPVDSNFLKY